MRSDAVVVGAGIIGLAVARELAHRGLSVSVLTRDQPGSGASFASAGMLEVHFPAPVPPNLAALCRPSRALYGRFADGLTGETGVPLELDTAGTLTLAPSPADFTLLKAQCAEIPGARLLERPADWTAMEGALSPDLAGALFLPDDHHVNPRRVCEALLLSLESRGVPVVRGVTATRIIQAGGRAAGVETDAGPVHAGLVVLATGAWAGRMEGLPIPLPVRPVRGQILVLEPRAPLRHVLHGPQVYAVPRADGAVLLGATVEEAGFDVSPTAGGIAGLVDDGARLAPPLRDAVLREVRVGLRPGTPDTLPIYGESGLPGLLLAAGPFRKGVLLAPITASIIGALAAGEPSPVPLGPYAPGRFGAE